MHQSESCKQRATKRHNCSRWLQRLGLCTLATAALAPVKCLADPFVERDWQFESHYHQPREMSLTPVRMMDDETLFLAAEAERNRAMNTTQRLINNHWLIENKYNTYSGGAAIGKLLRMTLAEFWRAKTGSHLIRPEDPRPATNFRELENYRLKLSDDSVKFSLTLAF